MERFRYLQDEHIMLGHGIGSLLHSLPERLTKQIYLLSKGNATYLYLLNR